MNLIETTVSDIRSMSQQNFEDIFFTTQLPTDTNGKYWRIQPDCTLPDDGINVLVTPQGNVLFILFKIT